MNDLEPFRLRSKTQACFKEQDQLKQLSKSEDDSQNMGDMLRC